MKIHREKRSHTKRIVIIFVITLLLLCGAAFLMHHYHIGPFNRENPPQQTNINLEKPTSSQTQAGSDAKNDFSSRDTEASLERKAASGESAPSKEPETVSTIISSSNLNESILSIRSIIQTIDSSGTCTLTLSKSGSQSITKSASTDAMGSYSTCEGFDIDTSGLAKGEWEIKLIYKGSAGQNGSTTKKVTL